MPLLVKVTDLLVRLERHSYIDRRMVSLPRYIYGTKVDSLLALYSNNSGPICVAEIHITAFIGNAYPHLVIAKDVPWPGLDWIGCGMCGPWVTAVSVTRERQTDWKKLGHYSRYFNLVLLANCLLPLRLCLPRMALLEPLRELGLQGC